MKFRFLLILALITFSINSSMAQSIVTYRTYNDFVREKGVNQGDYVKWKAKAFGKLSLILDKNGEKVKLPLEGIWGFEYKGQLFRVFRDMFPAMVMENGEMLYYENGIAHLDMLLHNKTTGEFSLGSYCYFSFGLDGELIACPTQRMASQPYKYFKKYRKTHPKYEGVLKCLDDCNFNYSTVRMCVVDYNKSLEEY